MSSCSMFVYSASTTKVISVFRRDIFGLFNTLLYKSPAGAASQNLYSSCNCNLTQEYRRHAFNQYDVHDNDFDVAARAVDLLRSVTVDMNRSIFQSNTSHFNGYLSL